VYACACVCVSVCVYWRFAWFVQIRRIVVALLRRRQRQPLVCCLHLLLLLLFYSHSHIAYISVCVRVSYLCTVMGCVCMCVYLPAVLYVCVLVRWGRRRSYVFACCLVGFDSVLDGWYGLVLDCRLPDCLPPLMPRCWLLCCCCCFSSIHPFSRSSLHLPFGSRERRPVMHEC